MYTNETFVDISHLIPLYRELRCGVYILCHKKRVVYVGQSRVHGMQRAMTHIYSKSDHDIVKEFDEIFFVPCRHEDVDAIEKSLIRQYEPYYNKAGLVGKSKKLKPKKAQRIKRVYRKRGH